MRGFSRGPSSPSENSGVSRLQLLLPIVIWVSWLRGSAPEPPPAAWAELWWGGPLFGAGFLALVAGTMLLARRTARRVDGVGRGRSRGTALGRFQRAMGIARLAVVVWFAVGVYGLGWGQLILPLDKPFGLDVNAPITLLAILPALAAWMALWCVQFPVDRAVREQNLLIRLNDDLPVHAGPSFRQYFFSQLRLQILLTLVPVLLVLTAEDAGGLILRAFGGGPSELAKQGVTFASIALVFLLAPLVLRRVLPTQRLPDGPLRERLEATCRRLRLGYRDILVWRTHFNIVNAAVMGLIPQVRYILLSDLLLETMDDRQVEAVFAHEVGHVVHRHMAWYVVFVVVFCLGAGGLVDFVTPWAEAAKLPGWVPWNLLTGLAGIAGFVLVFGSLSRRFERQADVFAARSLTPELMPARGRRRTPHPCERHVEYYGAELFNSALARLAVVNNIPIASSYDSNDTAGAIFARPRGLRGSVDGLRLRTANWWHGSIPSRMSYLRQLSANPAGTSRFDRQMTAIRLALVFAFCASVAWMTVSVLRGG